MTATSFISVFIFGAAVRSPEGVIKKSVLNDTGTDYKPTADLKLPLSDTALSLTCLPLSNLFL